MLLLGGRVVEALRLYRTMLTSFPPPDARTLFEANNNIGVCYYALRRYSEALDVFNAAILVRLRREMRAAAVLGSAAVDAEVCLEPIYNKGLAFIEVGYYDNALRAFQCSLEQSNEGIDAKAGVVRSLLRCGRQEAALAACDAMVSDSPHEARVYLIRGYCYHICGRAELALTDLRVSLRLQESPGRVGGAVMTVVFCDFSQRLLMDGEYSRAIALLVEARGLLDAVSALNRDGALVPGLMAVCRNRVQASDYTIRFNVAVALVGLGQLTASLEAFLELSSEGCLAYATMVRRARLGAGAVAVTLLVDALAPMQHLGAITTSVYRSAAYLKRRVLCTDEEQSLPVSVDERCAHPVALLQTCISVWAAADTTAVPAGSDGAITAPTDDSLPVEDFPFSVWIDDARNIEACLRVQLRYGCWAVASSAVDTGALRPDVRGVHCYPVARADNLAIADSLQRHLVVPATGHILCQPCTSLYPLQALQSPGPYPLGVDVSRREEYLLNSAFEDRFGMTKHIFRMLPKWKQVCRLLDISCLYIYFHPKSILFPRFT